MAGKRAKIAWRVGGALTVVLLLSAWVALERSDLLPAYRRAPALYAEARRLGMPGTVSQAFPAESSDSGMILFSLAEGLNQEAQATQAFENARRRELKDQSPVDWKAVAQELETRLALLEVYLDQIEPELRSESIYMAHKWYDPFGALPELSFFRATVRGYALRAELMAIRGDPNGALRQLESIRLLAQGIRETPTLIHFLVATSCDAMGMGTATNCMTADPGGAHEYAEAASFDEQILEKDLARALRVDAFMTVQTVRGFRMGWRKFEWGIDPERGQSDALPRISAHESRSPIFWKIR